MSSNVSNMLVDEVLSGIQEDELPKDVDIQDMRIAARSAIDKMSSENLSSNFFDLFQDKFEEELARTNLLYFITSFLPEFEIGAHHVEWATAVQSNSKCCIIAARGHGKSHFFSYAYPLWQVWKGDKGKKFGIIITHEESLGISLLEKVKEEIHNNPKFKHLEPSSGSSKVWSRKEIQTSNGSHIQVKGHSSAIRGRHPYWVVVDDYLNDETIWAPSVRDKSKHLFFSGIMPAVDPKGQVLIVGTPFHEDDLYYDIKKTNNWFVREYPAVFPDGTLLWESKFSKQHLLDLEAQNSLVFAREYLCRAITDTASLLPLELIASCYNDKISFIENRKEADDAGIYSIMIGCDLAISSNIAADYTVYTVLGMTKENKLRLLYIWRTKGLPYNTQVDALVGLNNRYHPDSIVMEDNAYQKVMVELARDKGLTIRPHTTTAKNKFDHKQGVPALQSLFQQKKIELPYDENAKEIVDLLSMELGSMTFTEEKLRSTAAHDDMVMSLWLSVRSAHQNTGIVFGYI